MCLTHLCTMQQGFPHLSMHQKESHGKRCELTNGWVSLPELLSQKVWGRPRESAFLTSSPVMPTLLDKHPPAVPTRVSGVWKTKGPYKNGWTLVSLYKGKREVGFPTSQWQKTTCRATSLASLGRRRIPVLASAGTDATASRMSAIAPLRSGSASSAPRKDPCCLLR